MDKKLMLILLSFGVIVAGCGNQQNQAGSAPQGTQAVSGIAKKAQVLLTQAKEYLDQGKFNEAITVAQHVLVFDPNNFDAQEVIGTAKAKLAALAEQKAGKLKSDLINKLDAAR